MKTMGQGSGAISSIPHTISGYTNPPLALFQFVRRPDSMASAAGPRYPIESGQMRRMGSGK